MDVLIVDPWLGGSHERWAREYVTFSNLKVEVIGLSARHWKWRMQGGALTMARRLQDWVSEHGKPGRLILSSMIDLAAFRGLLPADLRRVPIDLYFHENQFAYPWEDSAVDRTYQWLNITSALAADRVFFNSDWNRRSFLEKGERFLRQLPAPRETGVFARLKSESEVLPLGIDCGAIDSALTESESNTGVPRLLWNHRLEHDKNPFDCFAELCQLQEEGQDFELIILGEDYRNKPEGVDALLQQLEPRIIQQGYLESRGEYLSWLGKADILPVTAQHDFFGLSVVEALYAGAYPVLPNALVYPEHLPENQQHLLYQDFGKALRKSLSDFRTYDPVPIREKLRSYDWPKLVARYDRLFGGAGA